VGVSVAASFAVLVAWLVAVIVRRRRALALRRRAEVRGDGVLTARLTDPYDRGRDG
jgi:hypothetical protein